MSTNIFVTTGRGWAGEEVVLLESSRGRAGLLLNPLPCTVPRAQNDPAPNAKSNKVEKP